MKDEDHFIKAYHDFRESIDFEKKGILPEVDDLVWCLMVGLPEVPADEDTSAESEIVAIEQRVSILKAVFVEVNKNQTDEFLDRGLSRYDRAGKMAAEMLTEDKFQAKQG